MLLQYIIVVVAPRRAAQRDVYQGEEPNVTFTRGGKQNGAVLQQMV